MRLFEELSSYTRDITSSVHSNLYARWRSKAHLTKKTVFVKWLWMKEFQEFEYREKLLRFPKQR